MPESFDFAVIGLGVMGSNLALNMASKGLSVLGFDLDQQKSSAASRSWAGKRMAVASSPEELVRGLQRPRRILIMVPAGSAVDAVIRELSPLLQPGDIVLDGGNSFFQDTIRRGKELETSGIHYIGLGVSGGEEGALHGPALMPGGPKDAYELVAPALTSIAAKADGEPCCAYLGKGGAGHYVKMVHNGIEYAIMQLLCEAYDFMKSGLGMTAADMQKVFSEWNQGDLSSYLVEITATVLGKTDPDTNQPLVDVVLDTAGQKGTGKWTSQNALDLGIAVPTINAALEARILSAMKDERVNASQILARPTANIERTADVLVELRDGLRLAIISCYAQGFSLTRAASVEYGFDLDFARIARIWKGGCIIRAKVLDSISTLFAAQPDLQNLFVDEHFASMANELWPALRRVTADAIACGVPCLAFAASLGYLDSYSHGRLPANLLQAQRDCFGAHRYERIDRPRGQTFHSDWLS